MTVQLGKPFPNFRKPVGNLRALSKCQQSETDLGFDSKQFFWGKSEDLSKMLRILVSLKLELRRAMIAFASRPMGRGCLSLEFRLF